MKSRGVPVRGGDVVQYIFCLGPNGESSKSGQADRAYHPDEIVRSKGKEGELKIGELTSSVASRRVGVLKAGLVDNEYYLSSQILPSIGRLCEPIDGTDRPRLAECLGECLSSTKFPWVIGQ